jgi:hypothetical protein
VVKALGWDGCLLGSNLTYGKEKYQIIHIGKEVMKGIVMKESMISSDSTNNDTTKHKTL